MSFQTQLTSLVNAVEIDRDFTIHHANYLPLTISPDLRSRFKQLAPELQTKYVVARIRNYLYDIYFDRSLLNIQAIEAAELVTSSIKTQLIDGVDVDFYQRLQQSNTSLGYRDLNWQIIAETEDRELIVVKDGLHLHISRQKHLPPEFKQANIGETTSIYLPHNLVDRDTYISVGSYGSPQPSSSVQLYFNFTPDAAVAIVRKLTGELNQLKIPFQFAILHDPALFYRCDCGTLRLDRSNYSILQSLIAEIYHAYQSEFSPQVPLFTKLLAPGLSIAEVPVTGSSFGMQRCELLATGLFTACEGGQIAADKLSIVERVLRAAKVDLAQPYLNPAGSDCYDKFG
ncbi:T3SS effector HopA1 family protein [Chamaesiphon sp. VAR_48_metabat_403]|uniref:T3SS effector HopA1 family protein n=1 Tax=Chamaesiphon sp. VAR_48_metabat_403 TaxID=2964700 RepID=UPI00286E3D63|nr:T3SS effector HopA1 family protein [Chamaesiphon sp. VAR_48_metabat_403]